ncbi:MAG: hypothetical protein R3229_01690 [Alphaproteobacteria bacterium]|nr:hypothetical protein [Alphaproteobacteria bacterium]
MKLTPVIVSSIFALSLFAAGDGLAASGKVEKIERGGRTVVIAGTKYKVSGSRTKITIGGKKAKRGAIKVGMECTAEGKGEAKAIACK